MINALWGKPLTTEGTELMDECVPPFFPLRLMVPRDTSQAAWSQGLCPGQQHAFVTDSFASHP